MANGLQSDILSILEQLKQEIQATMQAKRINASGRTSRSLHTETYDKGLRLVGGGEGAAPIPTLEFGRGGGAVPKGFYYIIKQWTRDKGLNFASETERGTFAYFVARKIAAQGTHRHEANEDVYSTHVMNARERINAAVKASVQNTLAAALGGAKVTNIKGAFID